MEGQWLQWKANGWPMDGERMPMDGQWKANGWPMVGEWRPMDGQWMANCWRMKASGWPMDGQWLARGPVVWAAITILILLTSDDFCWWMPRNNGIGNSTLELATRYKLSYTTLPLAGLVVVVELEHKSCCAVCIHPGNFAELNWVLVVYIPVIFTEPARKPKYVFFGKVNF